MTLRATKGKAALPTPEGHGPTEAVMATYTDRELLDSLLDLVDMPRPDEPDFDVEGHDECSQITVARLPLREALRRRLDEQKGGA